MAGTVPPIPAWRAMQTDDLDHVERLSAAIHAGFHEDRAVYAERHRLFPDGCMVLAQGSERLGYLIAHPWVAGDPPALGALIGGLPERPDVFYLHDLALAAVTRGTGASRPAIDHVERLALAAGFDRVALVAVGDAGPFWISRGFVPVNSPHLHRKLASYGGTATYMERATGG